MTTYATRALQTGAVSGDATLAYPNLDPLLTGAKGGVRCLFDLDFGWCYPGGPIETRLPAAAPGGGQVVYDMTRRANLQARVPATGPGPVYAGGGFDFSAITYNDAGVRAPDAWASIYAADNDFFLWVGYFRMPVQADWNAAGSYISMFASGAAANGFASEPDPLTIAQFSGKLVAARQTGVGSAPAIEVIPTAEHYGKVCQIAYWRNTGGIGLRLVPLADPTKAVVATGAVGNNNAADFSACLAQWGVPRAWNGAPMSVAQQAASNTRLYRGWIEDLTISGRDPIAVLNADLQRVLDRQHTVGGIFV